MLLAVFLSLGLLVGWIVSRIRVEKQGESDRLRWSADIASRDTCIRQMEEEKKKVEEFIRRIESERDAIRNERDQAKESTVRLEERVVRIEALEDTIKDHTETIKKQQEKEAILTQDLAQSKTELQLLKESLGAKAREHEDEKRKKEASERELASSVAENRELKARAEAERKQAEEKLALLQEARESLTHQFQSLANEILDEKAKKFTEQNRVNLGQLLTPLGEKITEFKSKVEDVYDKEKEDRVALREQVRQLMDLNQAVSADTRNLTQALKGSSKTQGTWGELILERILEASGLREGEEYDLQESHIREDGTRAQPDVVIHLPGDKHLIVDSKVSLTACQEYEAAETEEARNEARKRHIQSIRTHLKGLSEKNYQALYGLKSLDFVLMFVPLESAYMLAVAQDSELFMEAWKKNVLLVSPSTLLFVVRTVAHLWRQEAQSRNAQEIAKRGAKLYDEFSAFVSDLEKVGERLRQAQTSFEEAKSKLCEKQGNVIRQAEMLKQLGVKPAKALPQAMVERAMDGVVLEAMPLAISEDEPED